MHVTIADYGPSHIIRDKAEAEVYAAQYKPGTRLYVPYMGKTPRGMLGIYAVTIVSMATLEDSGKRGRGKIVAECSDRKPYTRKAKPVAPNHR